MNQPPYIPTQDAQFNDWFINLENLLATTPADYGITIGQAGIVTAQLALWTPAYAAATNPSTRTPVTVATKTGTRVTNEAVIRPICTAISRNPAVSDGLKIGAGLNVPNFTPVPIPAPLTNVVLMLESATPGQHILQYRDAESPTSKKKAFGAIGAQLWRAIGVAAAVDPEQCSNVAILTKTPAVVALPVGSTGKVVTYFARWVTKSGPNGQAQYGPWSLPLVTMAL